MKGVVIFDERANLAFYTVDKEMEEYVYGRMQELEEEGGAKVSWCSYDVHGALKISSIRN